MVGLLLFEEINIPVLYIYNRCCFVTILNFDSLSVWGNIRFEPAEYAKSVSDGR